MEASAAHVLSRNKFVKIVVNMGSNQIYHKYNRKRFDS